MNGHFTPFRLAVVGLIAIGVVASLTVAEPLLPAFLVAAMIVLLVGRSQGRRF